MWNDMEEARKAAFQAQSLSAQCQQLCTQSEEDTMRMREDIKKSLELRVKDEEFWIRELEMRAATLKSTIEDLRAFLYRLQRGLANCEQCLATTKECLSHRKKIYAETEYGMKALSEEQDMLTRSLNVITELNETIRQRLRTIQETNSVLEKDLRNKYAALQKDQQSMGLKLHSPQIKTLAMQQSVVQRTNEMMVSNQNWKDATNANIKHADEQITATKLVEEQTDVILRKLTTDLSSEFEKVSGILQDNSLALQQHKKDLENHLAMVDQHVSKTNDSKAKLEAAIEEKKKAILLIKGQLQLHHTRPKSELCTDKVQLVIQKELTEAESDLRTLQDRMPQLEKTMRSLRRSRLQIIDGINQKTKCIETEELKCLGIRVSLSSLQL